MKNYNLDKRRYVISGVAIAIVVVYIIRLFTLQLLSDDYKKNADSNAFLKKVEFPSRGVIRDRHGKLLVYNQPSYDIMVVTIEIIVCSKKSCSAFLDFQYKSVASDNMNTLMQLMFLAMLLRFRKQILMKTTIISLATISVSRE